MRPIWKYLSSILVMLCVLAFSFTASADVGTGFGDAFADVQTVDKLLVFDSETTGLNVADIWEDRQRPTGEGLIALRPAVGFKVTDEKSSITVSGGDSIAGIVGKVTNSESTETI